MDDKLKAFIEANLVAHPERHFDAPVLAYTTMELEKLIEEFELPKDPRPVYEWSLKLLQATVKFGYGTSPEKMFVDMRLNKTPEELQAIFTTMQQAYQTAQSHLQDKNLSEQDKIILTKVLNYSKTCILKSIDELSVDDPLRTYWNQSALKKLFSV